MFKSVRIQNFRQFKDLKLDNLAQINLITGANNTGKTSLLEALWIYQAGPVDPSVVQAVSRIRGIDQVSLEGPAAWGWIFNDHKRPEGVVIQTMAPSGDTASLQLVAASVRRGASEVARQISGPSSEPVVSTASVSAQALEYRYTDPSGKVHFAALDVIGKTATPQPVIDVDARNWYFLSNRMGDPEEEARIFDRQVLSGHEEDLLVAYRTLDERVVNLRSLDPGTGHRIYAQVDGNTLLPISVMGHGFYRVGKIASAIVSASSGIALIDEIDDGLHYAALVDVWKLIIDLSDRFSVQVFATTHSYECIKAAMDSTVGRTDRLALFRLSRKDGDTRATTVEDEGIRAAVEFAFELR